MKRKALLLIGWLLISMFVTNLAAQTNTPLDVPFFSQLDSRWRDNSLGGGNLTIGSDGCTMIAAAMVLAYFSFDVTPSSYNDWLTSHNGYNSEYRFYWSKIGEYSNDVVDDNGTTGIIRDEIDNGYPVIARTIIPEHWVVIVDYSVDSQGKTIYYVNDPLESVGHTMLTYSLAGIFHYIRSSTQPHAQIGQFPQGGIAGLEESTIKPLFESLWHEIRDAYGFPDNAISTINNSGGGCYVHKWGNLIVQDVKIVGLDNADEYFDSDYAIFVLNPSLNKAFFIAGRMRYWYLTHEAQRNNVGPPKGNPIAQGTVLKQEFEKKYVLVNVFDEDAQYYMHDYATGEVAQYNVTIKSASAKPVAGSAKIASISSVPAQVWHGDELIGTAPLTVQLYQGFTYTYTIKREGYPDLDLTFKVELDGQWVYIPDPVNIPPVSTTPPDPITNVTVMAFPPSVNIPVGSDSSIVTVSVSWQGGSVNDWISADGGGGKPLYQGFDDTFSIKIGAPGQQIRVYVQSYSGGVFQYGLTEVYVKATKLYPSTTLRMTKGRCKVII